MKSVIKTGTNYSAHILIALTFVSTMSYAWYESEQPPTYGEDPRALAPLITGFLWIVGLAVLMLLYGTILLVSAKGKPSHLSHEQRRDLFNKTVFGFIGLAIVFVILENLLSR